MTSEEAEIKYKEFEEVINELRRDQISLELKNLYIKSLESASETLQSALEASCDLLAKTEKDSCYYCPFHLFEGKKTKKCKELNLDCENSGSIKKYLLDINSKLHEDK